MPSSFGDLEKLFGDLPAYRFRQAKEFLFQKLISDWSGASSLPADFRSRLNEKFPLAIQTENFFSRDGQTVKALITLADGLQIESVLMNFQKGRRTVCVSSQVGCPLGCSFCATGKMGLKRSLTDWEIIAQVLFFARYLKALSPSQKITNLVFMGMGEPLLNYEAVSAAIRLLHDPAGFNLGWRHLSVSTAGIVPGIERFAREDWEVNLAISLHAPNDELRSRLMPVARQYSLKDLFGAVADYVHRTNRKVMFEYLLIDGINDSLDLAAQLVELMTDPLYLINLIPYNPTGVFSPSSQTKVAGFKKFLLVHHLQVTERHYFGQDIHAACGQLATG